MQVKVKREVEARYLAISVAVRYGDEDIPYDAPMRTGDTWQATIDLDGGMVVGWPPGETLSMNNMKVCDQGTYLLLDADKQIVAGIEEDYVPNRLLPGKYGDYLSLEIDEAGKITNWLKNPTLKDFEEAH